MHGADGAAHSNLQHSDGRDGVDHVQVRFENRCPIMFFSNALPVEAGRLTRRDAQKFLTERGWSHDAVHEMVSRLEQGENGNVWIDQDQLVLWHDAVDVGDGRVRDMQSAASIVMSHRSSMIQFQGSIVQPKDAPSPAIWHEQACRHFGLKGVVRLRPVGMIVETSLLLQGSEADITAYRYAVVDFLQRLFSGV